MTMDKGLLGGASDLVGGATDGLKEMTTGALGGGGPWHSPNSDVYHNNPQLPDWQQHRPRERPTGNGRQIPLRGVRTAQRRGRPRGQPHRPVRA